MASKRIIFVTVLGGVAEIDPDSIPEDLDVEIVAIDSFKGDMEYL